MKKKWHKHAGTAGRLCCESTLPLVSIYVFTLVNVNMCVGTSVNVNFCLSTSVNVEFCVSTLVNVNLCMSTFSFVNFCMSTLVFVNFCVSSYRGVDAKVDKVAVVLPHEVRPLVPLFILVLLFRRVWGEKPSLVRKRTPIWPYRRPVPRVLGGSQGAGRFLIGKIPLHSNGHHAYVPTKVVSEQRAYRGISPTRIR